MNPDLETPLPCFPLLGRWRSTRAIHEGIEIAEPNQEGEFLADGSLTYLLERSDGRGVIRLTGRYFFTAPDQFWVELAPGRKASLQRMVVKGDEAELHHGETIHFLRRIRETEFSSPVVDGRPYSPRKRD